MARRAADNVVFVEIAPMPQLAPSQAALDASLDEVGCR